MEILLSVTNDFKLPGQKYIDDITQFCTEVKEIGQDGWEAIKNIGEFFYYLMHPKQVLLWLWKCIDLYCFWICLFVTLASVILYSFGFKKFAKFAPTSIALYTLIKAISVAI